MGKLYTRSGSVNIGVVTSWDLTVVRSYVVGAIKWSGTSVRLRDCRKSPKRAILAILHVMKSNGYEHQKHKFRVFRQSLQLSAMVQIKSRAISDPAVYYVINLNRPIFIVEIKQPPPPPPPVSASLD